MSQTSLSGQDFDIAILAGVLLPVVLGRPGFLDSSRWPDAWSERWRRTCEAAMSAFAAFATWFVVVVFSQVLRLHLTHSGVHVLHSGAVLLGGYALITHGIPLFRPPAPQWGLVILGILVGLFACLLVADWSMYNSSQPQHGRFAFRGEDVTGMAAIPVLGFLVWVYGRHYRDASSPETHVG
jgi:drug/metabolite transporter (DMT)-like permease